MTTGTRGAWFVYTDDLGADWAMQLPRNIGQHPAFAFTPLGERHLPVLRVRYTYVGPVRPRHVRIDPPGPVGRVSHSRTVPIGTRAAFERLVTHPRPPVSLPDGTGQLAEWTVEGRFGESITHSRYVKARAAAGA
jgi:hypothetical protein